MAQCHTNRKKRKKRNQHTFLRTLFRLEDRLRRYMASNGKIVVSFVKRGKDLRINYRLDDDETRFVFRKLLRNFFSELDDWSRVLRKEGISLPGKSIVAYEEPPQPVGAQFAPQW